MTGWFVWTANENRTNCINLSFSDRSSPRAFPFENAASLIKQFIPLVNRHFCWRFPPNIVRNLLCTATGDLDSWNHSTHLAFSTWDSILTAVSAALKVERFGNSNSTNYKFDHITYSNAFSFLTAALRFMNSITVKWHTFHVYFLHITFMDTRKVMIDWD
jgi:hypothetical protein